MESFFVLLGLAMLVIPVLAIAAFVMVLGAREQLRQLQSRVQHLEAALRARPAARTAAQTTAAPVEPPAEAPPIVPDQPAAEAPATPPEPAPVAEPAVAATAVPSVPAASTVPPTAPAPEPRAISFEERFGTQWVVWIGGLALALGGLFLVRYSIEAGLIGPGVRIALGALLALALIAAGEWTRRNEIQSDRIGVASAHIPSILTAAGTVVAYGTVYAAYALYGFLGPAAAFILLGIVALATLAAALLHGPALAGLGVIGAYVTPVLVSSDAPDYWSLYVYLAVVTGAAFALARAKLWPWLAAVSLAFGFLWVLPGLDGSPVTALGAHVFHAVVGFALAAALIVSGLLFGPPADRGRVEPMSSASLSVYLGAAVVLVLASLHDPLALGAFTLLTAATLAAAWRSEAAAAAVPAAAALTVLVFVQWAVHPIFGSLVAPSGPAADAIPDAPNMATGWHLALAALFGAGFGLGGFLAQARAEGRLAAILWSATAVAAPLALLGAAYYRIAGFERSIPFAGVALVLAALYAVATETLLKREPRAGDADAAGDQRPECTAIFATGAVAALALSLTLALDKGWLTVSLALMVLGVAWIAGQRPLPFLRWLVAALVVAVIARVAYEPRIVGDAVGTTPIFNWLLYGYGVPAVAFWLSGRLLRRHADDVPARMTDSAAILFTVLLGVLQIRHYMNAGDVYRDSAGLGEVALQAALGLAGAIGLERVRARTANIVHDIGALIVAGITFLVIVFGLLIFENPIFTGRAVGGAFFNQILLGYGLTAVLAAALALVTRGTRPQVYRITAAVTAVVLALAYLTLQVTRLYHGPVLTLGPTTDAEQYTYSAVWLAFGVALLLAGIALRSQPARLASAAVVVLTVGKVFLLDMAGLTGVYRALSFIGLGVVLVGIGLLYQRLLFPRRATTAPAPGAAE